MRTFWVIGTFTGNLAKRVKEHADSGIGYFVRSESGNGTGYTVEAAFRWVQDKEPLPEQLVYADPYQQGKLNDLLDKRSGVVRQKQEN